VPDGSSLILCYHNVVPDADTGYGDASLHIGSSAFEQQLKAAGLEADLVSLPELLAGHGLPGRRIAVTFDDAYRGCLRWGIPLCQAARVHPTVFIAPGLWGRFTPWDLAAHERRWSSADRHQFLEAGGVVTTENSATSGAGLPEDYGIASEAELLDVSRGGSFTAANHTKHHINLSCAEPGFAVTEITDCEHYLRSKMATQMLPGCLAYPYGLPPVTETRDAIREVVSHGFLVSGGWLLPESMAKGMAIPRLNVPAGISLPRFRAQLRGRFQPQFGR
jgi:peptidoglycan/xylan/chitin deacetylase (PgdA/CDA1 family)